MADIWIECDPFKQALAAPTEYNSHHPIATTNTATIDRLERRVLSGAAVGGATGLLR